jgi:hypothetical protein
VVKVHAAKGCWEHAQAVLQPAVDKAQDAVEADVEEEESEFTGALEAVLFQLVALSLQAAWHLQHAAVAADMFTLCTQVVETSQAEERACRLQHLVGIHLKYVALVLTGQCSVQQLQQSWSLLQQATNLVNYDAATEACTAKWITDAKADVRLRIIPVMPHGLDQPIRCHMASLALGPVQRGQAPFFRTLAFICAMHGAGGALLTLGCAACRWLQCKCFA